MTIVCGDIHGQYVRLFYCFASKVKPDALDDGDDDADYDYDTDNDDDDSLI